jgi:hypothetical protein
MIRELMQMKLGHVQTPYFKTSSGSMLDSGSPRLFRKLQAQGLLAMDRQRPAEAGRLLQVDRLLRDFPARTSKRPLRVACFPPSHQTLSQDVTTRL